MTAWHLLLVAVLAGTTFLAMDSVLPRYVFQPVMERELGTHLWSLRNQLAAVQTTVTCPLNGRRLLLGDATAWASDRSAGGAPRLCAVCECALDNASVEPEASLSCTIHDCPMYGCGPAGSHRAEAAGGSGAEGSDGRWSEADPEHRCCRVCAAAPDVSSEPRNVTVEPPRTMDPLVPVTADIYPGTFLHLPADLCAEGPPLALVSVTSQPAAAERRALFRRLYGAAAAAAGLRLVFLLGADEPVTHAYNQFADEEDWSAESAATGGGVSDWERRRAVQAAVDAEAARHGDIIQSAVPEHYYHLALKTVALLDAFRRVCSGARFLVKTDDDVLVDVPLLAAEVAALPDGPAVYGRPAASLQPNRPSLAWQGYGSSVREWPADSYPPLVLGNGYLVAAAAAGPLLRAALAARYHHLEDVFVTGVAAEAAGVERRPWERHCLYTSGMGGRRRATTVCEVAGCALTHRVSYEHHADRLRAILYATERLDTETLCRSSRTRPAAGG
ncbi:acetylgalactosaminyl-O-glycosyl-glycoprotein beta-1,3-N-acetylglucosaminyltransferase-like isoform X1 [Amphibalanus amphitrite]|uniref:acetylgalactosaminyl-O-glycosyl-glycoprotein beta-1,3-N-acetylglucosaminyltransferase-like isoform X1 n=2 Tax=Amphibalanus amphitrite TaxID=1232801 RepID=UPI001C925E67|nr:acetylgalactosaminyl-O-glycosyl-glycoprotein beta-1,3-N-acetylglucosaminyltransferase-like isoform X1 [Amphibalanus amphitrite]